MLYLGKSARFVSDLHLSEDRPDITDRFEAFLEDTARRRIEALAILGDLFEYWIGDDDLDLPFNAHIVNLLRALSARGVALYFVAGNRDFLIDAEFAQAARLTRLEEIAKVGAGETELLVMHGDLLCTDDVAYQEFRRLVRTNQWRQHFLQRPLAERRAEVAALRRRSVMATQEKSVAIMDVNPDSVLSVLAQYRCRHLIHGHTHRPGCVIDESMERWTLSDWDLARGDAIEVDAAGIRRLDFSH